MQLDLDPPLESLPGVGPARARALAAAGFERLGDLLFHVPLRYEDRSTLRRLADAAAGEAATFRGRLGALRPVRVRRRGMTLVRGVLSDGSGELPVVWFNRPYLAAQVDPDAEYLLHGPVREKAGALELLNPSCERAGAAVHSGRVVPVYGGVGVLGAALVRRLTLAAVAAVDPARSVADPLPADLLARHDLPPLGRALAELHAPGATGEAFDAETWNRRRSRPHLRLIYGELLDLQLALARLRRRAAARPQPFRVVLDARVRRAARAVLPFRLTGAQKRALGEIAADLARPEPMLRLLQGDVGSGKTIVAALALLAAIENGLQGAFMAPTELLAEQHFQGLSRLLGRRYRVALLTASAPDAAEARRLLAAGEIDLAVGTHALIQEGVGFRRLGLAVIDEQHRFGVEQRRRLQEKGACPNLLVMTATPIPRSLALAVHGDLDLSVLDELPPGRRPVATELLPARRRPEVYRRLARELSAGDGRAYVVFPRIEADEAGAAASLERHGEEVRRWLAPLPVAFLHGRMSAAVRERTVADFAAGRCRVLVATTIVEVGVDVPEATVMVIENADRFGLAQLHQLRGRVGRSARPSRCVAIHGRPSTEARHRLATFRDTTDGFRIAEEDLLIRGPGDVLGTRQAGLPSLRVADLVADGRWLSRAREDARELVERLEEPELAGLRRRVEAPAERAAGWAGG
ncbi:MAG TPA: ATP-dependent DNA helicase RecG [Thermoanaerobaculia bacterium]|nr:ATP-dependent DNA helicase RecG [Thermoanaerobaculia bacterium]